jgi:hypothetical protein
MYARFKEHEAADRFCRQYDELRNFLRSRSRHNQHGPATRRRRHFLQHARIAMASCRSHNQWIRAAVCLRALGKVVEVGATRSLAWAFVQARKPCNL